MGSELNIAATERELAYRSKNYSDLKAFERRELFCSSCGNILSHDSRHIYSHPIFGILQCENCKNHFKTVTFSLDKDDSVRNCHICGRERASSYGCVKPNCPYEFCKTCIKRNVPQSLVDAESGKWKCFACNPKPLWKLRGACAAVMSSLPKRTKSKKVKSRERSSDREDERSSLKDRSYVRRTQAERNSRLSEKLSLLCDNESPNPLEENHPRTIHRSGVERAGANRGNDKIKTDGKSVRFKTKPGRVSRLTSSDTDIEEIVPLPKKKMVKTKFHRENSSERSKLRTRERESRNDSQASEKGRGRGRRIGVDVSEPDNSSDDSDLEEMDSRKPSKRPSASSKRRASRRGESRERGRNAKAASRNSRRDVSSDSSSDDSVTASLKRAMPTAFAKKPKTTEKSNSKSSKQKESSDDSATRSTTKSTEASKKSEKKRKLRRSDSLDKDATISESRKSSSRASAQDVSVILSDIANVVEKNSRKTYGHLRMARSKPGSDSSSSKEFRSSKFQKSGLALHRFQDVEEDFTMSPRADSRENPNDEIPKQQSFALKKSVRNFLAELKTSATKLLGDIDLAQKTYFPKDESMRESMKPVDANRMILDTKRVLGTWKDCVRQGETKITDYYDGWCKKTRQRNIWRSPKVAERIPKSNADATDESGSESSAAPKTAPEKRESRAASAESVVANGDKPGVVSDCDSEEIFSNDETRMSIGRSNAATPEGKARKAKSEDRSRKSEEKNRGSTNVSEESEAAEEENEAREEPAREIGKTASPTMSEFSGRTEVDEPASKPASPDPKEREDRSASPDIFDTSLESEGEKKSRAEENTDETVQKKASSKKKSIEAKSKASGSASDSESEGENKSSSRVPSVGHESDDSKRASSRAASPARVEEDDEKVDSPVAGESDDEKKASSRAPSPQVDESDCSKDAPSRAPSPQVDESDCSKDAPSRAPSPQVDESDCSKDAPSRSASPTLRQSDDSSKALRKLSGAEDSEVSDEEKSKEVATGKCSEKNSEAGLSDAETEDFVNPMDLLETFVEEKDPASDAEEMEVAEVDSVEKSAEKAASDAESVATILQLSPTAEQTHSSPDSHLASKSAEKSARAREKGEEKTKREKSSKKREKIGGEKRRDSSMRTSSTASADDLEGAKKSKDRNDSGASSDLSDADNARAREAMLMSSNSDDSSVERGSRTRSSNPKESNDSPLTPPESDSKSGRSSGSPERNLPGEESQNQEKNSDSEKPRKKRSKFRLNKNRFYIADEKLKKNCEVRVKRLKDSVLERYSRALRKSRKYVESKEIQRLIALDKLDKNKKKAASSSSEDEDSSKTLTRNKKKTRAKEPEETLMDHLKKVKNGENIVESSESDGESSTSEKKSKAKENGDDNLFEEANRMAKKRMLDSSESAAEEQPDSDAKDEEVVKKTKKVAKKEKVSKSSDDDEEKKEKAEKAEKGRWRKNKILTLKISDSDSDEEREKFDKLQEKLANKKKDQGSDSDEEEDSSAKKKKRVRRRVLHSDSDAEVSPVSNSDTDSSVQNSKKKKKKKDDSDEDEGEKKKTRKRTRRTRSSDSSMDEARPKPTRRKRIKTAGTDSDSDGVDNSQGSPGKTGRKNIRKVLRDKQVASDTKQAAKEEEERLKRIADRQKLYNEMYEVRLAGEQKVEKLVLDFDEETKEPLVSVDEGLVKRLKPHQAQGIKFMWDACFESLERTKNTKGSGCILAHCMGLGKSFQIVTLAHTLLMHPETGIKTVLVVCPLSTVLNWANEFKIWLADLPSADDIEIYEMTKMKKIYERKYQLEHWRKTGGVMIIGYEMFRNLSSGGKRVRKNVQESFIKSLVDPGPDLIVCDEGHLLKREATALSKAMTKVRTLRRIVLTGTPLQNNLIEYHCMVQFVKPALLGTKREFMNRFENPITNGQFDDSTEYDVKLMKKRAHVLHKMLEGSVQRFDYSVLTPFLPPKQEYVIFVKLTEIQIKMYQYYLENYARSHRGVGGSLFADFQALQRIWTHPMVMQMNAEKTERANEKKRLDASDSEGSLKDFIDDGSDTPCTSEDSDVQSASGSDDEKSKKKPQRSTRANPVVEEPEPEATNPAAEENNDDVAWWNQFIKSDDAYEDIRISSKLLILFMILKECEQIGDKVLVFSQSLYSLTLIEKFLGMIDDETQKGNHPDHLDGHSGSWALGLDYFRLDGQSSADNRRLWCNVFNRPSNTRARLFLISTRAGGLGINLTAANRVIIFDASWNPSHDVQSIFRIYRFGQKKPCYVYRLLAAGTMEEKIYNRQVTKLSLSCRVVDEQQIERHYTNNALAELYKLELPSDEETTLNLPKDRLLAEIFLKYKHCVETYHEHDSLLENQAGEELDEEERQQAWLEYEEEKKGRRIGQPMQFMNQDQLLLQQINMMNLAQQQNIMKNPAMIDIMQTYQGFMQKDYPGLPEAQHKMMATKALYDMYNSVERQAVTGQRPFPMMNVPTVGGGQFGFDSSMQTVQPIPGHPSMDTLRMYQQSLAQAQNGLNNYSNNQGHMRDNLGLPRQAPMPQMGQMTGMSAVSSSIDDDIVEIPSSPERNPVPSGSAPSGSGKSKEE